MPNEAERPIDPSAAAAQLAKELESRNVDYAIGGAIALGYCAQPRGTVDVDLTLFFTKDKSSEVIRLLQQIGCEVVSAQALASLLEHGFCRVKLSSRRIDVFIATTSFYEQAKSRRRRVDLEGQPTMILDGESLAVFKMMFFRRQDMADIEMILKIQRANFDRDWVRQRLVEIVGPRDPRVAQWDELVNEIQP